ncbi:MAG: hypothetical protein M1840_001205 [Geoglossum simile]|nr:MAG: hypothetical protein M1840_001205 [Geoglossum simile]
MSQAITRSHRYWAWNIIFVTASDNATLAGSFQPTPPFLQFLTWRMLFGDITLSFNLQSYLDIIDLSSPSPPSKDIGLWVRSELGHVYLQDESSLLPCIYMNSQEQNLDQMVAFSRLAIPPPTGGSSIGEYDQGDEEVKSYLTIVLHDHGICADAGNANICTHIRNGMNPFPLVRHVDTYRLSNGNQNSLVTLSLDSSPSRPSPLNSPRSLLPALPPPDLSAPPESATMPMINGLILLLLPLKPVMLPS